MPDPELSVFFPGPAVSIDTGRFPAFFPRLNVTLQPGLNVVPEATAHLLVDNGTCIFPPTLPLEARGEVRERALHSEAAPITFENEE